MLHWCLYEEDSFLATLMPTILQIAWANTDLLPDHSTAADGKRLSKLESDIWNSLSSS